MALFVVAGYNFRKSITLQESYDQYRERLRHIPGPHYNLDAVDDASVRNQIILWDVTGVVLVFAGIGLGILALFFYKKTVHHQQLQHARSHVENAPIRTPNNMKPHPSARQTKPETPYQNKNRPQNTNRTDS